MEMKPERQTSEMTSREPESEELTLPSALKAQPTSSNTDKHNNHVRTHNLKAIDVNESLNLHKYNVEARGDEADQYDFSKARPSTKRSNVSESILHLIRISIGSGVATVPEAYKNCGLWTAFAFNIFIGIAVAYSMFMLTWSAQKLYGRVRVPMMLYPDIAEACVEVGPCRRLRRYASCFRYTVDVTIALGLFSACCVYQVAIAKTLKQLIEGSHVVLDEGKPSLTTYILLLMLPCLMISMITTLKYLAPFAVVADLYFGMLIVVCIAITTVYYGITVSTVSPLDFPAFKTVPGLFEFFGICIFSINGIGASMSVENHMEQPEKFPIVVLVAMGIVITEVTLIGFFGHLGYGDKVQSLITWNYPYRPFPIMLKIFMTLVLYVTYALNFWLAFELVWYYGKQRHARAHYWFWERIYRATFVIIVTMVAYLLPNVYYLTGLIGTLCLSNLCFIFPAVIELFVVWEDPGLGFMCCRLLKFIFFFSAGMAVIVGGTYFNTKSLIAEVFFKNVTVTP